MTRFTTPTRAAVRATLPVLGRPRRAVVLLRAAMPHATLPCATLLAFLFGAVALLFGAVALLLGAAPAQAFTPTSKGGGEATALNLSPASGGAHTSTGGASIVRTIVGLLIVIAVIWGLSWILKQVKGSRETRSAGSGLSSLATLALGSGRTLHLVRAGRDYLLVGSAEHGVAPIHRYTEQQARDAGLLDFPIEDGADGGAGGAGKLDAAGSGRPRPIQMPGQARSSVPGEGAPLLDRLREWTVRR